MSDDPTLTMSASEGSRLTIEEELGLQAAKVKLGLQDEVQPVPVGRDERYLVRKRLGRGSMGAVFLADDLLLNVQVALKAVAPRRLEHGRLEERLKREAQALAALRHENIVRVYDLASTEAGELFITMEYVSGTTLREWQSGHSFGELLDAYLDAGRGLAAAHARGIVHRDIKPDNVLVEEHEGTRRVLVSDFGLAGVDPNERDARPRPSRGLLTSSKGRLGTLAYMAPEQLRREQADARSDQHQYCVALWEALAGKRPFPDEGRSLEPQARLPPRPPTMPWWVHRVLLRGLAFERDERYPGMSQLLAALERGRRWRRSRPWVGGGALLGVVGFGAWRLLQPDPCEPTAAAMAEIWTKDARRSVGAAFRGLKTSYAEQLASHVVGQLDRVTAEWTTRAVDVCRARIAATEPDETLDRRKACLDQWPDRVRRGVELLQGAGSDPAIVVHADELVGSLEPDAECQLPPVPIDPQVRVVLGRAVEAQVMGHAAEALELAEEAVGLAARVGAPCGGDEGKDGEGRRFSRELAAALFRLGHLQRDQGQVSVSLQTLDQAHLHALACDDGHRFADARIHAAKVLAVDLGELERAGQALREAEVELGTLGEPSETARRREQWKAAGLIAQRQGRQEDARAFYERGLATLGEPRNHPIEAAKLIHDIGITYQTERRDEEAQEAYDRAVELVSEVLGADSPQVKDRIARWALSTALLAVEQERFDVARARFETAIEHGPPIIVAKAYTALAQSEHEAEELERAEQSVRALLMFLANHTDLPPEIIAQATGTAGQVLADRGDPSAIGLLDEAILRWTKIGSEQGLLFTRFLRAKALQALGRDDEARQALADLLREPGVAEGSLAEPIEFLRESLESPPTESNDP